MWGGNIEAVRLESDEAGWELVVETDDDVFRFNAHAIAGDLGPQLGAIKETLEGWLAEGREAAREHEFDLLRRAQEERYDRMVGDA